MIITLFSINMKKDSRGT